MGQTTNFEFKIKLAVLKDENILTQKFNVIILDGEFSLTTVATPICWFTTGDYMKMNWH